MFLMNPTLEILINVRILGKQTKKIWAKKTTINITNNKIYKDSKWGITYKGKNNYQF